MFDSPLLLTAFIGVMLASVSTSLLSVPVTMNKVSFMSEAFAHITFSGIALALLFEWNVTAVSLIAVIFFSLLRKAVIVIPLTLLLPHVAGLDVNGVFLAEPISNFIGGTACFVTMLCVMWPALSEEKEREMKRKKQMDRKKL